MKQTIVDVAIQKAGGYREAAAALGISFQAVFKWKRLNRLPAERVLQLEKISGVSRHDLRPDLYPRERRRA